MVGATAIESEASEPICVTPRDIFPPAAPKNLQAVGSAGVISLIWEANTEPDVAGYQVLRGEGPGDTLQPLTPEPIKETRYQDRTTKAGVTYRYAIVAVDRATPPNKSAPSNRVQETAR
jgi:fibronectin type 3 domain-containing protein